MSDPRVAFVHEQIVLADGRTVGEAMANDAWVTERVLRPALALDGAGSSLYRLTYVELPRGHWKSGGVAAIALTEATLEPSTDVVIAAADRDQAAIVLEYADLFDRARHHDEIREAMRTSAFGAALAESSAESRGGDGRRNRRSGKALKVALLHVSATGGD